MIAIALPVNPYHHGRKFNPNRQRSMKMENLRLVFEFLASVALAVTVGLILGAAVIMVVAISAMAMYG